VAEARAVGVERPAGSVAFQGEVSSGEPTMKERVEQRLRPDKILAKATIEVVIDGRRVEAEGDRRERRAKEASGLIGGDEVGVERVTIRWRRRRRRSAGARSTSEIPKVE